MPLLFQWTVGLENRPIPRRRDPQAAPRRLATSGITDADGRPLTYQPHYFRRIFTTDAKMGRIASDATFP
jgi:hypothetical protein